MQGRQDYQPELFSIIDIEKLIPKNHLLRKLDRTLDLSFIRDITSHLYCQDNGRPSIDPELFFRMQLLIYLYDISSDRMVCEEISYNLAYRWFCRLSLADEVPDHSSLTKIRDRLGEETFKKIFDHIVGLCVEKKIAKGEKIMADGTLVKADAALNSLVEQDEKGNPKDSEPPKYIIGKKYSNDTHVSYTDPDCKLAGKTGEPKQLRYKVHAIADRESRVILDTHVTAGSVMEGSVFLKRLDYVEGNFGFKVAEAVADRGYGYGEILQQLAERDIKSFVPNFHSDVGSNIEDQGFQYDKGKKVVICPEGLEMEFSCMSGAEQGESSRVFSMKKGQCRHCPRLAQCIPVSPDTKKRNYRKRITINLYRDVQEETKAREQTAEFRAVRGERQWKMEGIFAEAKNYHGLNRARYRRRNKMQIQAYMIASVQNLKRLIEALTRIYDLLCHWSGNLRKNILGQHFFKLLENPMLGQAKFV